MADLSGVTGQINPDVEESSGAFTVLPAGKYKAVLVADELKDTKAGTGKILEINRKLDANPELVNSNPYGDGWMVKIEIAESSQIAELLSVDDYKDQIGV